MAVFGFQAIGNILVTAVVTWTLNRRSNLAVKLLSDLRCYRITAVGIEAVKSKTSQKEAAQRLTKQQAAKVRKREADIGDAETVSIVSVSSGQIESTPFFHYLDIMITMLPVAMANFALGKLHQLSHLPPNIFPTLFASIAVFLALRGLFAVNILSKLTPATDKWFSGCAAAVSAAAATLLFAKVPRWLFALDTNAASQALSQATGALLRSKAATEEAKHMEDPEIHPMILESGLVLLAIVLGGLLLTPMTRTTISYMAATNTPDWAEKRVGTSAGTRLLLNINLLLPGLVALIWATPLFEEVLEVRPACMPIIKAAALTTVAVLQLLSTRPLVQAYLSSGLIEWHRLKYGAGSSKKLGDRITAQLDSIHVLFVKVAIQCSAPAVILLGCAVILMQPPQAAMLPSGQQSPSADMLRIPISFWQCIADFCGWWTCICCFAFSAVFFALFRSKLLSST